jgi:dihydrofolate synthase/folylpolyglutamate synthase
VQNNSYKETIDWLFQQFPSYQLIGEKAYKPTLENCQKLASYFGNPEKDLKFIHIAGTNGKGSTSAMLSSILTESGFKVGLFSSPHIQDFRERIRVNGLMISEKEVIDFCNDVKNLQLDFSPSFFEITWILALIHFKNSKCDYCVIETGLGGRLDATNIITPILSVITNISLEHTNFLGNTLSEIAFEKAGIIKNNIPVVIGETTQETEKIFNEVSKLRNSPIHFSENLILDKPVNFPFVANYQLLNYRTVINALQVLSSIENIEFKEFSLHNGLHNLSKNTGFYGRLQQINDKPLTFIDVSHNFDGIKSTLETIKKINKGKLHIIYGTSNDKDLDQIFTLFDTDTLFYFTEFNNERTAKIQKLKEYSSKFNLKGSFFQNIKSAISKCQQSTNEEDTILIFGSFFLISDFF